MDIEIVAIFSACFAGGALIWNGFIFRREQKNAQVKLLADFLFKAVELQDKEKDYIKEGKVADWCLLFLSHLEYLAYLVNKGYLPIEMTDLYRGMVITWYEEYLIKQKDTLLQYTVDRPQAFSELKALYEKLKERDKQLTA